MVLFLSACQPQSGSGPGEQIDPGQQIPLPEETEEVAQLLVFTAPWCEPCEKLHPALNKGIHESATLKEKLLVIAYVTTGASSSQMPTPELCEKYKAKLAVDYSFVPDPWKWTTFKKYFGSSLAVPAAVVLDVDGNVLQKFPPGSATAPALLRYLRALLGA